MNVGEGRMRRELVICAFWYSMLVGGRVGNYTMKPALHGAVFSLASAFHDGEPMFGVAASAIYVWLTLNNTFAMPVFLCAFGYVPLKTIVDKKSPKPTIRSITTAAVLAYLTALAILESMSGHTPHALTKFFYAGGPQILSSTLVKPNGSFKSLITVLVRTVATAMLVSIVPLSSSQDGQLCLFYIACVVLSANVYDIYEAPTLWWNRHMRRIVRAL